MKNLWILSEGYYGNDITIPVDIFSTKQKAVKFCRSQGFKLCSDEGIFYKDDVRIYRNIEGPFKLDQE